MVLGAWCLVVLVAVGALLQGENTKTRKLTHLYLPFDLYFYSFLYVVCIRLFVCLLSPFSLSLCLLPQSKILMNLSPTTQQHLYPSHRLPTTTPVHIAPTTDDLLLGTWEYSILHSAIYLFIHTLCLWLEYLHADGYMVKRY